MIVDIENMISHFSWPTFWGITSGIMDIKKFLFDDLPAAIHNCGDIPEDFSRFFGFFDVFSNTTLLEERLETNLFWYASDIIGNFNDAGLHWDNGQFYECGVKLGQTLVDAVGDHSQFQMQQDLIKRAIANKKVDKKMVKKMKIMKDMLALLKE